VTIRRKVITLDRGEAGRILLSWGCFRRFASADPLRLEDAIVERLMHGVDACRGAVVLDAPPVAAPILRIGAQRRLQRGVAFYQGSRDAEGMPSLPSGPARWWVCSWSVPSRISMSDCPAPTVSLKSRFRIAEDVRVLHPTRHLHRVSYGRGSPSSGSCTATAPASRTAAARTHSGMRRDHVGDGYRTQPAHRCSPPRRMSDRRHQHVAENAATMRRSHQRAKENSCSRSECADAGRSGCVLPRPRSLRRCPEGRMRARRAAVKVNSPSEAASTWTVDEMHWSYAVHQWCSCRETCVRPAKRRSRRATNRGIGFRAHLSRAR